MSATTRPRMEFHRLTVAGVERLCADAVALTFDVPPELADSYAFRAGQSLTLRRGIAGRDERRSYSICAAEGSALRIGVREVPGGLFSTWLVRHVRPGDGIEVGTPTGAFTPDLTRPGHHALVAAGSGITPVLSIASTVLCDAATTVTLVYGNRRASTVMFADEVGDLKDRYPTRVELIHLLSREPREAELFSGRPDAAKLRALVPDLGSVDHWWLCGPLGMITDIQELLRRQGVPGECVHKELFTVDGVAPPPIRHEESTAEASCADATVVLDGRRTAVALPRDVPILDGAQRARPDLPFACKAGVCGTCRARITAGRVRMRRNFALEESEVDEGFVLTCQSLPDSDALTVDYDA